MRGLSLAALFLIIAFVPLRAGAQYISPGGVIGVPVYPYYGCGGIYLELARQNDDLARIRARLRRLELETDEGARARQWIGTLEAENRNLRQQNGLFQQRVLELEAALAEREAKDRPASGTDR